MLRRTFLAASAFASPASIHPAFHLIAHRGGIVDADHAENSPASLLAAIDAGYWMIEIDIRRTKDNHPILQHDPDFGRYYNTPRRVEEMTWDEIDRLRAQPGGHAPLHLRDACRLCHAKTRFMLDIKAEAAPPAFYSQIAALLDQHNLLHSAYLLGGGAGASSVLAPHCRRSTNRTSLAQAIKAGEDVQARCFLFELAGDLDQPTLELCRQSGVTPVAAINTFRYTQARRDESEGPRQDAARLIQLGLRHFQIDSRYQPLFTAAP